MAEAYHYYQYELGQPSHIVGQSLSTSSFTSTDQTGNQKQDLQVLPSFEGFYRNITTDNCQKKDTETSVSDQSSDSSFSIENIMRGDITSAPRSSTPGEVVDQSERSVPTKTDIVNIAVGTEATTKQSDYSELCPPKTYKRHDDKPPYTYAAMIIMAIEMSERKALALAGIRVALQDMFPFFNGPYTGWRESVRHSLSKAKYFYVEGTIHSNEPSKRLWKVNTSLLKPAIFKRTKNDYFGNMYEEYLHEQLGVAPVCQDKANEKSASRHSTDIVLPSQRCFQPSAIATAEASDSDDFLRARKEVFTDTDEARSEVTSPPARVSSVASDWSVNSLLGKRKRDLTFNPPAKMAKSSTHGYTSSNVRTAGLATGYDIANAAQYQGFNSNDIAAYNYQMAQYQMPYYQMQGYQMPNYQMQGYQMPNYQMSSLYPSIYREPRASVPSGSSHVSHYSDVPSGSIHNSYVPVHGSGLEAAVNLWNYRQQYAASLANNSNNNNAFNYDYRWYSHPEVPHTEVPQQTGIDLRVTPHTEEQTLRVTPDTDVQTLRVTLESDVQTESE